LIDEAAKSLLHDSTEIRKSELPNGGNKFEGIKRRNYDSLPFARLARIDDRCSSFAIVLPAADLRAMVSFNQNSCEIRIRENISARRSGFS
jgi:hypothetical protein